MKRLLFIFCLAMNMLTQTSAQGNIAINTGNFPDQKFREYLLAQSYGADGILTTEEINGITEIDAYGIDISSLKGIEYFTALTTLDCADDQLTSLDVSKNMALTTLYCGNNKLTSLDVSTNTALTTLDCSCNQIKGAQTEAFVNSLPSVTNSRLYFCNLVYANEKNEMTDILVAKAKAKGWMVYAWNGSVWAEYAGVSTGIENVEQAEPGAVHTYTLDGRLVSGQPTKKGIYIRNGRKVIMK